MTFYCQSQGGDHPLVKVYHLASFSACFCGHLVANVAKYAKFRERNCHLFLHNSMSLLSHRSFHVIFHFSFFPLTVVRKTYNSATATLPRGNRCPTAGASDIVWVAPRATVLVVGACTHHSYISLCIRIFDESSAVSGRAFLNRAHHHAACSHPCPIPRLRVHTYRHCLL